MVTAYIDLHKQGMAHFLIKELLGCVLCPQVYQHYLERQFYNKSTKKKSHYNHYNIYISSASLKTV